MTEPETAEVRIPGNEGLIPIWDIPRLLPRRPNGKRLHISACYRWITRGVRGVKLEIVRIGGSTYTSHEALARFASALSPNGSNVIAPGKIPRHRQRQIEQAAARVQSLLKDGSPSRQRSTGIEVGDATASQVPS